MVDSNMGNVVITGFAGLIIGFGAGLYMKKFQIKEMKIIKNERKVLPILLQMSIENFDRYTLKECNLSIKSGSSDSSNSLDMFNYNNDPILRSKSPYSHCSTPTVIEDPVVEILKSGKTLPWDLLISSFISALQKEHSGQFDLLTQDVERYLENKGKYLIINNGGYELYSKYNIFTFMSSYHKFSDHIFLANK